MKIIIVITIVGMKTNNDDIQPTCNTFITYILYVHMYIYMYICMCMFFELKK